MEKEEMMEKAVPLQKFSVKGKGTRKPKEVIVDTKKSATHATKVSRMFDKNKCWDIFQEAKTDNNMRMY